MTEWVSTSPPPSLALDAWDELEDAVTIVDDACRPLLTNDAFRVWTRMPSDALSSFASERGYLVALGPVLSSDAVDRIETAVMRVTKGESQVETLLVTTLDAATLRLRIRSSRAYPGHAVIVHTIVTKEEQARLESEALSVLADVVPDAIVVTDARLRVTRWNAGAERALGIPASQAIGKPVTQLVAGLDEAALMRALSEEHVFHDPPLTSATDVPSISAWGIGSGDEHPRFVSALFLLRDNTPERRARFAAAQANERLRQAQRLEAVGALAGGVAHDFNNLLSVIQSYTSFVLDELPPGSPLAADVQEIVFASQRGAALTRQLLAFGRRQVLEPEATTFDVVVAEVDRLLARLLGEHISVITERTEEDKPIRVDVSQLEQVIINLALHAREAMPRGGVLTLRTRLVRLTHDEAGRDGALPGTFAELAVTDTGAGIDQSVLDHIFEPFFAQRAIQHGTGLGLATAFGIVRQSGGHITAESTLGVGTTFRVRMPLAGPVPAVQRPQRPTPMLGRTRPAMIVVVEDEPNVREIARRSLSARGYAVHPFPTANDALPFIQSYPGVIDLLITDLVMPGMSGAELSEHITRARPGTRILFMTGYADDSAERLGITLRGRDVLHKPFAPATLVARVRTSLESEWHPWESEDVSELRARLDLRSLTDADDRTERGRGTS